MNIREMYKTKVDIRDILALLGVPADHIPAAIRCNGGNSVERETKPDSTIISS